MKVTIFYGSSELNKLMHKLDMGDCSIFGDMLTLDLKDVKINIVLVNKLKALISELQTNKQDADRIYAMIFSKKSRHSFAVQKLPMHDVHKYSNGTQFFWLKDLLSNFDYEVPHKEAIIIKKGMFSELTKETK